MKHFLSSFLLISLLVSCSSVTDVIVVGGGTSGVAAGIQAARSGANTLVIEETPWLGGMLTAAGVSAIDGNYNLRGGIFAEFCDSLAARYGGYDALKTGWVSNILFEPHVGNEILVNMASGEKGLRLCMAESFVSAERAGDVWLVHTVKKGKRYTYRAKVLIDATELGDVAASCGVPYNIGMDSRDVTGEDIAPAEPNDVIQDLTYVAVLKDYGTQDAPRVKMPDGYDANLYAGSCKNALNGYAGGLWSIGEMLEYGRLPGGKFMLNWPIRGNDYYTNVIDKPELRREEFRKAKDFTLGMVYFIQNELGCTNIGLDYDEFPTEDGLAFIPYHRESRRIVGEACFTVNHTARPFDYEEKYYRTGIAVGDYPVDHHHGRHPDVDALPDLHFYPVPSYNLPLGSLIPLGADNLIVAEKSVSVSNLVNGTTRLQPVVMQIGQTAGVLAAKAVADGVSVREVSVREVQDALLAAGGYIMPYLDLKPGDAGFEAIQHIGATGILKGEGRNVGWSNQTWFRAADVLLRDELCDGLEDYAPEIAVWAKEMLSETPTLAEAVGLLALMGADIDIDSAIACLDDDCGRMTAGSVLTRLQFSIIMDSFIDPFHALDVDFKGNFIEKS